MRTCLAALFSILVIAAGTAPVAAQAGRQSGGEQLYKIQGVIRSIDANRMIVHTDGGDNVTVGMSDARKQTPDRIKVGDRVAVWGVFTGANQMQAHAIREQAAGQADAGKGDWRRIHGRVQSVQGSTMRFRADDGRVLTVDMSAVSPEIQRALSQNERVTIIGFAGAGPNQFRAEYVQQDSSDPSRGGSVGSASPQTGR
jgi:hypothetical protein